MMDEQVLALWCKRKEIDALEKAELFYDAYNNEKTSYWAGKAEAFSNVWQRLLFGDSMPHPETYNKANEEWSKMANSNQRDGESAPHSENYTVDIPKHYTEDQREEFRKRLREYAEEIEAFITVRGLVESVIKDGE